MTPKIQAHLTIDTREQQPYRFANCASKHVDFAIERVGLKAGDYAAMLTPDALPSEQLIIERKTASDLLGTISHGRERFERELERMVEYDFKALVIEATLPELVANPGGMSPASIVGSLIAFAQRFNIHVLYAGNRAYAERLTFKFCERWVRDRTLLKSEAAA